MHPSGDEARDITMKEAHPQTEPAHNPHNTLRSSRQLLIQRLENIQCGLKSGELEGIVQAPEQKSRVVTEAQQPDRFEIIVAEPHERQPQCKRAC